MWQLNLLSMTRVKTGKENIHETLNEETYESAQFDQSLRCPHEETLHPWLSEMCPTKIPIRIRSESSLGAHVLGMLSDVAAYIYYDPSTHFRSF